MNDRRAATLKVTANITPIIIVNFNVDKDSISKLSIKNLKMNSKNMNLEQISLVYIQPFCKNYTPNELKGTLRKKLR